VIRRGPLLSISADCVAPEDQKRREGDKRANERTRRETSRAVCYAPAAGEEGEGGKQKRTHVHTNNGAANSAAKGNGDEAKFFAEP